jgi:hypothetical protein
MSGIERESEERGQARVSLPDGARMRARRRGRARSPGGRGASTGGEAERARRGGAEVLAGGVRLWGQGRQRGGERRLVGGGRRQREGEGLGRVTATACVIMNSGRDDRMAATTSSTVHPDPAACGGTPGRPCARGVQALLCLPS